MTSIYSADNPYYPLGPSAVIQYRYTQGSVMDYIYRACPVFAHCLQKTSKDQWVDSDDFRSTIFIPSEYYCAKNFEAFKSIDIYTANRLVLNSIIYGKVNLCDLATEDMIPNYASDYIQIRIDDRGAISVDGLEIRKSIECTNGIIHILDGLLSLEENYIH